MDGRHTLRLDGVVTTLDESRSVHLRSTCSFAVESEPLSSLHPHATAGRAYAHATPMIEAHFIETSPDHPTVVWTATPESLLTLEPR
jgi:hypothetical protein